MGMDASQQADVFRAIADPARRAILDLLAAGERAARLLHEPFSFSQPALSKHLRILRTAGLVRDRRVGRERIYRLVPERLREVHDWIGHYQSFWADRLDRLGNLLDDLP